jgi:imidazolonepropionase-like amidohydrolase
MYAIEVGRVFDGERVIDDGAVVTVAGHRIVGVAQRGTPLPAGCKTERFPDATLLPGLIDTHVHLCCDAGPAALERLPERSDAELAATIEDALAAHLAAGVTTVRDLGDIRWAVLEWRQRNQDDPSWPTVLASGPPITVPGGHCGNMGGEAEGVDALRRAARERAERGADVVKLMASGGLMTPGTDGSRPQYRVEEIREVVEEARGLGLAVTAHAHAIAAIEYAVEAGVAAIEHCTFVDDAGMRLDRDLVAALSAGGTWVCPTLGLDLDMVPPPAVRERLCAMGLDYDSMVRAAVHMHREGVRLVSGTDAGIMPAKRHGMLPEALVQLGQGGVTAAAALVTATSAAATACGIADRKGRVSRGFDADLLVVDGDPLSDLTALRDVRAVYLRGRRRV